MTVVCNRQEDKDYVTQTMSKQDFQGTWHIHRGMYQCLMQENLFNNCICICMHTHIYVCIHIGGRHTTTNIGVDIEVCIYRDRQGKMKIMKKQRGRNSASYTVYKTTRIIITPSLKGMKREIKITRYLQYH